jgi:hypothetical protein
MEAHRFVRHRDSHIFKTVVSQTALKLSDLFTARPLPPERLLVQISVRG